MYRLRFENWRTHLQNKAEMSTCVLQFIVTTGRCCVVSVGTHNAKFINGTAKAITVSHSFVLGKCLSDCGRSDGSAMVLCIADVLGVPGSATCNTTRPKRRFQFSRSILADRRHHRWKPCQILVPSPFSNVASSIACSSI